MRKSFILFKIAVVCTLLIAFSCTSDDTSKVKTNDTLKSANDTVSAMADNVDYQIPSPEELFLLIKSQKLPYREALLNLTTGNYVTTISKELNLGIYIADLSYCSVFKMNENTLKYFTIMYKIAENLGISAVVGNAFLDRLKNNINNPDSLSFITNSSYFSIIQDLDNGGKGKTVGVVAAGGWIEGMYIITNLVDKFDAKNPTISSIAGQKIVFNNLIRKVEKYQSDKDVAEIKKDLNAIKAIYDQMKVEKNEVKTQKKEGKIILGSKEKASFTEEQYNDFKQKIKEIRTKYVK
ncbi:MAG: hypothetical protein HY958_10290 [Bacteroidia bacterium]|nr:hypothetical protein [Bacteroidia bacterium]